MEIKDLEALFQCITEIANESERGCVLVAHAFLDEQLKELLQQFLRRLSGVDGIAESKQRNDLTKLSERSPVPCRASRLPGPWGPRRPERQG